MKTGGRGTGSIVNWADAEQPQAVIILQLYAPGAMPPVAEVCVLVFIPFGKGDHVIVYPGTGVGGLNVRFRLNAFRVLVQLL